MLKIYTLIIVLSLFLSNTTLAQRNGANASKKYFIQLPASWKGKTKLLLKITHIAEKFVPELSNKQFCLNCEADYWINFYISAPAIEETFYKMAINEFTTLYRFTSFMDVYNENNVLVKRFVFTTYEKEYIYNYKLPFSNDDIMVGQNSINQIKKASSVSIQNINSNNNNASVNYDMAKNIDNQKANNPTFDAQKFMKENRDKLIPTQDVLWNEVENVLIDYKIKK